MSAGGANLGVARGEIQIAIDQAIQALNKVKGEIKDFGGQTAKAGSGISAGFAKSGAEFAAAGAIITGGLGLMVNTAANFEQSMDGVSASLGGVGTASGITTDQFAALRTEALRIGSETSKSAGEAAQAMDLMAKAGVSAETILGGGAQAAVNLSEATGEQLAQTAETMSASLNLFADTGIKPAQAADILTTAMNNSNASMSELQTGLVRMAPAILATGMGMDEAAANIAFFNAKGIGAAEVGTSMQSAFNSLTTPTAEGAAAMKELGISAFDAQGQFVGFPAIMDQVQKATAGMTEEQKAQALASIFQADAMDVMTIASNEGGQGVRDLTDDMNVQGSAAESSRIRMDNFKGSVEQLKGAIETLSIQIGDILLPYLRTLVDGATKVVQAFSSAPPILQKIGVAIALAAGAFLSIGGAIGLLGPRIADFAGGIKSLMQVMTKLPAVISVVRTALMSLLAANPVLLLIGVAVALFAAAYMTNFLGIRDLTNSVVKTIVGVLGGLFSTLAKGAAAFASFVAGTQVFQSIIGGITAVVDALKAFNTYMQSIAAGGSFFTDKLSAMPAPLQKVALMMARVINAARLFAAVLSAQGLVAALQTLPRQIEMFGRTFGNLVEILTGSGSAGEAVKQVFAGIADFVGTVADAVQRFIDVFARLRSSGVDPVSAALYALGAAFDKLKTGIGPIDAIFKGISATLKSLGKALNAFVKGDFGKGFKELGNAAKNAFKTLADVWTAGLRILFDLLKDVDWGNVWDTLKDSGSAAFDALKDAVSGIDFGAISNQLQDSLKEAIGADSSVSWGDIANDGMDQLQAAVGEKLGALGDTIGNIAGQIPWGDILNGAADLAGQAGGLLADLGGAIAGAVEDVDWGAVSSAISSALVTAVRFAAGLIVDVAGPAADIATTIAGAIWAQVSAVDWGNVASAIGSAVVTAVRFAAGLIADVGSAAADMATTIAGAIAAQVQSVDWNAVASAVGAAVVTAVRFAAGLVADVAGAAADIATTIAGALAEQVKTVDWAGVASAVGTAIYDAVVAAGGLMGDISSALVNIAITIAGALAQQVATVDWAGVASAVGTAVYNAVVAAGALMGEISGAVVGIAITIAGAIAQQITTADWGAVASAIGTAVTGAVALGASLIVDVGTYAANIATTILGALETQISALDFTNFGGFIVAKVQEGLSLALSLISGGLAYIRDIASAIGKGIADAIQNNSESFAGGIRDRLKTVVHLAINGVGNAIGEFASSLEAIAKGIVQGIADKMGQYKDIIVRAIRTVIEGIPGVGKQIADRILGKETEGEVETKATSVGSTGMNALLRSATSVDLQGIKDHIKAAFTPPEITQRPKFDGPLAGPAPDASQGAALAAAAAQAATAAAAFAAASSNISAAAAAAVTAIGTIGPAATTMGAATVQAGTSMAQGFGSAVQQMAQQSTSTVQQMSGQITGTLNTLAGQAGNAGRQGGQQFYQGVQSGMQQAVSAAQSGVQQINSALQGAGNGAYSAGYGAGQSLGQGIEAGINSMVSAIASAAAGAVNQAESAARAAADSHSPSRLFAAVGADLMRGMAQGEDDNAHLPADVMTAMIRDLAALFGNNLTTGIVASLGADAVPPGLSASIGSERPAGTINIIENFTVTVPVKQLKEIDDVVEWASGLGIGLQTTSAGVAGRMI